MRFAGSQAERASGAAAASNSGTANGPASTDKGDVLASLQGIYNKAIPSRARMKTKNHA